MNTASDVLESYVRDVAGYLPRAKRNDVAFELRALLNDELAAKAEAQGRTPDREMVMELLKGFGRPAEAAARYHPRSPLIDPADNHNFLIWAVVGTAVIAALDPEDRSAPLQWLAILFVWFAVSAWLRRRRGADHFDWRPSKGPDPEVASRPLLVLAGLGTLIFPFAMYLAPQTFWEVLSLGKSVSSGLALTDAFRGSLQRAVTLTALGAVVVIYAAAAVQGGWRRWSRRALIAAYVLVGGMFLAHARPLSHFDWQNFQWRTFQIFESQHANQVAMPIFGLVGGLMQLMSLYSIYREWARVTPAPSLPGSSST